MSLTTFFHEPSWLKINAAMAVDAVLFIGLVALRTRVVRSRKRNIYKPAVLIAETYGADTDISVEASIIPRASTPVSTAVSPRRKLFYLVLVAASASVMLASSLFALRDYTILNNWQEGNDRAFIGDYVGGIVCYKKALRADPSLKQTHFLIGVALLKSDKGRSAIPELQIAAKGELLDPEPAAVLGDALMILKRPAEAVTAYKNAIAIDSDNPDYYVALASALEPLRRLDEAYNAYQKAIAINPRYARAHIKLGEFLLATGHLDEARAHCTKAVELAPDDPIAHNTLAAAYARFGMYDEAIEEYRRSILLDPHGAVAYFDLGELLERKKDIPHALDAFRSTKKQTPRNRAELEAAQLAQSRIEHLLQKHL